MNKLTLGSHAVRPRGDFRSRRQLNDVSSPFTCTSASSVLNLETQRRTEGISPCRKIWPYLAASNTEFSGPTACRAHTAASEASPLAASGWAPLTGKRAVVVGAGPAGCTMAMYLAKAGWQVDVYERRPEPGGDVATSRQRSWVLALYPRGIRPVQAVADVPLLEERAYKGLVIKGKAGSKATVLERTGVLMDRTLLANAVLDAARRSYSQRITFHFDTTLISVDFDRQVASFDCSTSGGGAPELVQAPARSLVGAAAPTAAAPAGLPPTSRLPEGSGSSSSSSSRSVGYDLLVGADGSNSAVRGAMAERFPGQYDTQVLSPSSGCYKTFYGLPPHPDVLGWEPDSELPQEARQRGQFFFALMGDMQKAAMSLCRDVDGNYCGYIAAPEAAFDSLKSREDYLAVMAAAAPQMPDEWRPAIVDRLMESPISRFPTMRSLSRFWSAGCAVLVGDAAHTVTPSLGQGVNSALEDCALLAEELSKSGDDIPGAVRRFSDGRAPEILALQELELLQSALLTPFSWSDPAGLGALLLRKWIILHYFGMAVMGTIAATGAGAKQGGASRAAPATPAPAAAIPGLVRSPPMFELLRGHMRYSEMLERVRGLALLGSVSTVALLWGAAGLVGTAARMAAAILS